MRGSAKLLGGLLAGATFVAGAATVGKTGVSTAEEPQGISLRQESTRNHHRGFFYGYRSHRGGGLRGGK